jgi:hypothetical protein
MEYEDTHGGFHGDGVTSAKIQFEGEDAENILSEIKGNDDWGDFPLSENVELEINHVFIIMIKYH